MEFVDVAGLVKGASGGEGKFKYTHTLTSALAPSFFLSHPSPLAHPSRPFSLQPPFTSLCLDRLDHAPRLLILLVCEQKTDSRGWPTLLYSILSCFYSAACLRSRQ